MHRLIRVFAGHTYHIVGNLVARLKLRFVSEVLFCGISSEWTSFDNVSCQETGNLFITKNVLWINLGQIELRMCVHSLRNQNLAHLAGWWVGMEGLLRYLPSIMPSQLEKQKLWRQVYQLVHSSILLSITKTVLAGYLITCKSYCLET